MGAAAYLLALLATLPARFVLPAADGREVAGTIWAGEAIVGGAYRLEWQWRPWRSLASLGFAADWRLTGGSSDLVGEAVVGPGRLVLGGVAGRADWGLVAALLPGLPVTCEMGLAVELPRLRLAGGASAAEGQVRGSAGTCAAAGDPSPTPVPPLVLRAVRDGAGGTLATLAPPAPGAPALLAASLAGRRLLVAPTAAGQAALPFLRAARVERRW